MQLHEALSYAIAEIRSLAHDAVDSLDATALAWRPDPAANSIGWLLWHTGRVEDYQVAEIAGREQVWVEGDWAEAFGLPAGYADTGYGHSAEQVGQIRCEPGPVLAYLDATTEMVRSYLHDADGKDFDRVVDESYDPPVTAAVRLLSIVGDAYQHVGQAAYLRGLFERDAR
jgi:hypothetical protein